MLSTTSLVASGLSVLLASPDSLLLHELEPTLRALGLRVATASDGEGTIARMQTMQQEEREMVLIVLLDARLPGVADGRLLATMHECGVRKRRAIALIVQQVTDEWILRLREGVIDDIVPRHADAAAWKARIGAMQRGHALLCELEQLREAAFVGVQRDPVTGIFNRDSMLNLLFRETDRVQRLQGTMSLVALEVDDFVRWSGELGHEAGDQLLRQVVQRVGRTLRSYDLLGKLRRESFLLALPECSLINATMLAERLRMDIFGESFWVKNAHLEVVEIRLSGCFGITASRGRSPVVVVREVEQTLALARQSGPDTTRCTSDSPSAIEADGLARLFPEAELSLR